MNSKRSTTPTRPSTWLRSAAASLLAGTAAIALTVGCLDSPVEPQEPRTNNVYIDQIVQKRSIEAQLSSDVVSKINADTNKFYPRYERAGVKIVQNLVQFLKTY